MGHPCLILDTIDFFGKFSDFFGQISTFPNISVRNDTRRMVRIKIFAFLQSQESSDPVTFRESYLESHSLKGIVDQQFQLDFDNFTTKNCLKIAWCIQTSQQKLPQRARNPSYINDRKTRKMNLCSKKKTRLSEFKFYYEITFSGTEKQQKRCGQAP